MCYIVLSLKIKDFLATKSSQYYFRERYLIIIKIIFNFDNVELQIKNKQENYELNYPI